VTTDQIGRIALLWRGDRDKTAVEGDQAIDDLQLELGRIRLRLHWGFSKLATLEAAIVIETILKENCLKKLRQRGFSKKKLKELDDHFTFSGLLNLIGPMLLGEKRSKRLSKEFTCVNRLRKIRNDIMHEALAEAEIAVREVDDGIDAVLAIAREIASLAGVSPT
jgi:hypothetical protein